MGFFEKLEKEHNIKLNEGQRKVAGHREGPMLAVAVPGSGKTTAMMCRAGFLVETCGVKPGRILSVTFSRASAIDMKNRYQYIFGVGGPVPVFSTIHSFANGCINRFEGEKMRSLKLAGSRGAPSQEKLTGEALRMNGIAPNPEKIRETAMLIGYIKNAMLKDEEIRRLKSNSEGLGAAITSYEAIKAENGIMDFDDMLLAAHRILGQRPECLEFFRDAYDYFQMDEAQDTSKLQHEIFKMLSGRSRNILMCGDEDQSIYGWRGAAPSYITDFEKNYPGAAVARMERNYRSTKHIVLAMNRVISLNPDRYKKTMVTEKEDGERVRIERPDSALSQDRMIACELESLGADETAAVIYRRNRSGLLMAHELWMAKIPFEIEKGRIREFFHQSVFRDVTSFCKLVENPFDTESFRQVYHKMGLFINKGAMETIAMGGGLTECNIRNSGMGRQNSEKLLKRLQTMKRIRKMPVRLLFEELESTWGYVDYLEDAGDSFGYQKNSSRALFFIMKSMATGNETPGEYCSRLRDFWTHIGKTGQGGAVSLAAAHSAKGLEFDRVYVIDLVKDEFPFKAPARGKDLAGGSMEEERCLFYVAGTRARRMLCLLSPRDFYGDLDASPSPFLFETGIEIPADEGDGLARSCVSPFSVGSSAPHVERRPDPGMRFASSLDKLKEGERVKMSKFGFGVIEAASKKDDRLEIRFDQKTKVFRLSVVFQKQLMQLPEQ